MSEENPTPRRGRVPLDSEGRRALKSLGVWLPPHEYEKLESAVKAIAEKRKIRPAQARRAILMSGIRVELVNLQAAEDLKQ